MPPKKVTLPLQKSKKAGTKICEVVFMCEYCLATFPTGTDLLDHKYEDHNVDKSREEDEFAFFNQGMFEVGAESRQIAQPKPILTRTRSPTNKPPPTAASSNSSAMEVNAALTSSIAPTPAPLPALDNGHELESNLPHQSELVAAPSSKPEMSYSCEVCHQTYKNKKCLRSHQHRKHHCTTNHSNKSSSNDNVTGNNIVKRKVRSNGDSKIQSKISEKPDVSSREIKVTSKKSKVDEPQVKAVPAEATPFQTSSPKRKTTLDPNSKSKQTFPCKSCPKIFSNNANRSRHEKVAHQYINLQNCSQSSIPFTPSVFNMHTKPCDSKFNSTSSGSSSQLNISLKSFSCKICQKLFSTNHARCHHEKTVHHGDNIRKCLQCSISFTPKAFGFHKKECNLKFNSTPLTKSNTSFEPEMGPQPEPISSTPVISTQVSLGANKANFIDDDSETDYESADDTVTTNLAESASIPIPTLPPAPVVLVPESDSETDFEIEFESCEASQSQNVSIGKLSYNFEATVKNSSIFLKDANDKNGNSTGTDSHGHGVSEKLKCGFCFKELSSIEDRITHEAGHVRKQLFACNICRLHFVSLVGLESHKKRRHDPKM